MDFAGQVAIVTGAGRGLGRAYAQLLAESGARVVVNDLDVAVDGRRALMGAVAEQVAADIRLTGGNAIADGSSVADPDGARSLVRTALDTYGRIDIVINNAGILVSGPFQELAADDVRRLFEVHVLGSILVTQAVWPHLVGAGYGRVVLSTSGTVNGYAHLSAYSAMKGATQVLARSLALEGAPHGIVVNAISPSASTRMAETFNNGRLPADADERSAESVAPVVAYLAHRSCTLSGETVVAAGGTIMRESLVRSEPIKISGLDLGRVASSIESLYPVASRPKGQPAQ